MVLTRRGKSGDQVEEGLVHAVLQNGVDTPTTMEGCGIEREGDLWTTQGKKTLAEAGWAALLMGLKMQEVRQQSPFIRVRSLTESSVGSFS